MAGAGFFMNVSSTSPKRWEFRRRTSWRESDRGASAAALTSVPRPRCHPRNVECWLTAGTTEVFRPECHVSWRQFYPFVARQILGIFGSRVVHAVCTLGRCCTGRLRVATTAQSLAADPRRGDSHGEKDQP